jgi:hypothetical protein
MIKPSFGDKRFRFVEPGNTTMQIGDWYYGISGWRGPIIRGSVGRGSVNNFTVARFVGELRS